jgi:hypothetical protein
MNPMIKSTYLLPMMMTTMLAIACGSAEEPDEPGGRPDGGVAACTSGCTAGGECLAGTSAAACGADGDACQACGGGDVCLAGECVTPEPAGCGPANCDGCCDGDVCLSGTSGGACGDDGEACLDCGTRGICETAGGDHRCEVDPTSRWNLVALSATLPEKKVGGQSWDLNGGLPDGFARGKRGDTTLATTSTRDNTLEPVWNQPIARGLRAADLAGVAIEVLDDDATGDDLIGRCSLPGFSFEAFGGEPRTLVCSAQAGWTMRLAIEPD